MKNQGPLAALILLVLVATIVVAFLPLLSCPRCEGRPWERFAGGTLSSPCSLCLGRRRITLLRNWDYRRELSTAVEDERDPDRY